MAVGKNNEIDPMVEAFAVAEVARIETIRHEQGDEAWAQALGDSIVTQLTLMHILRDPSDHSLAEQGKRNLIALTPQLELLHNHPTQGHGAAAGMVEELASRQYIPLDVNKLINSRWRREGKRR